MEGKFRGWVCSRRRVEYWRRLGGGVPGRTRARFSGGHLWGNFPVPHRQNPPESIDWMSDSVVSLSTNKNNS
jgi:hypothetical protein